MVRENSIEAFMKIKENGLLSTILWEIYDVFWHHGPLTSRQANEIYCRTLLKANNLNQFRSKVTILGDMGVLRETEDVKCEVTGMTVAKFDVTANLPAKSKKLSRAEQKKKVLKMCDDLNDQVQPYFRGDISRLYNEILKL